MSWTDLLKEKRVAAETATKAELDALRTIVGRRSSDFKVVGLSEEQQFIIAYDAVRTLAVIVVRAAGYRPKQYGGSHFNTFAALEASDSKAFKNDAAYFQLCRVKRNESEYDSAGGIASADAQELVNAVTKFEAAAEAWIAAKHATLAKTLANP